MVQVLEKEQKIILVDLFELQKVNKKAEKVKVKAEKNSAKRFSRNHKDSICINRAKARLDTRMYGFRFNSF